MNSFYLARTERDKVSKSLASGGISETVATPERKETFVGNSEPCLGGSIS